MCRVLLLIGGNNTQRVFFLLRKDSVLYSRPFWDDVEQWASDAECVYRTSPGDVVALAFPPAEPPIATQDTQRATLADTAALLNRATRIKQISTAKFTERDLEIIHDVLHLEKVASGEEKNVST